MLKFKDENNIYEVGIDEAGRGTLIGPVFTAAVIWPKHLDYNPKFPIKDSKKLSKNKRYLVKDYIEDNAICYSVDYVDSIEIDRINILNATILSMHNCINKLLVKPDYLLIDGNNFKPCIYNPNNKKNLKFNEIEYIDYECVVSGDATYTSIAAASILAKTYHDIFMLNLIEAYPELKIYDIHKNMGYGTANHIEAINLYGITPFHRKSFNIVKDKQLHINFL